MNANLNDFTSHTMARSPDLVRCSRRRNIGDVCSWCTAEGLETVKKLYATVKRCKGCNHSIGRWADYCAECIQEDETDCW
jgi:hypothetical protein